MKKIAAVLFLTCVALPVNRLRAQEKPDSAAAAGIARFLRGELDTVPVKTPADVEWNRLQMVAIDSGPRLRFELWVSDYLPANIWLARAQKRWAIGRDFFNAYPTDGRRLNWLIDDIGRVDVATAKVYQRAHPLPAGAIFSPIPIPAEIAAARKARAEEYAAMRAKAMVAPDMTDELRQKIRLAEISSKTDEIMNWAMINVAIPVEEIGILSNWILEYAKYQPVSGDRSTAKWLASTFLDQPKGKLYGKTIISEFFHKLAQSENAELALYAKTKERFFALGDRPLDLRVTGTDGRVVELAQLRGKMVLVDFWSLGCSSCIAMFPKLKELYKERHAQGLEIITVSVDDEENRAKILELYGKHALPWTTVVGGADGKVYAEKYGVITVPHMFVIDQQGRMVDNGGMTMHEILRYVNELLPAVASK